MKKKAILFAAICLALYTAKAYSANVPPEFNKTFYGDANGDQLLMSDDIGIHKDYASRNNSLGYDTTQPTGATQYWKKHGDIIQVLLPIMSISIWAHTNISGREESMKAEGSL